MARALDDWIESYLTYTESQESPESFHFWTALVVLATALRRKVWLDRGWDDYLLYPNLYVLIVAESASTRKSQAIDMGLSVLKEAVPDIYTISDSATPEGIIKHLNRPVHTPGANGKVVMSTESNLLIHADELASLFSFDRNRASRMGILLTRVYRSPAQYKHTLANENQTIIKNPYFTLIAATAPQNFKVIPPESTGGLMGRLIIVTAKQRRSSVAWGPKISPKAQSGEELGSLRKKLVADLYRISNLEGEIRPTAGAIKFFSEWYEKQIDIHYPDPNLDAFHARCHDTALQLAMLLSVAKSDDLVLREEHVAGGIAFIEKQLPEYSRLVQWVGVSDYAQNRAKLMDYIKRSGGYTSRKAILRFLAIPIAELDVLITSMIEEETLEMRKPGAGKDVIYRLKTES